MRNLLKSDFYKVFKNKSLYICSLICLAFVPVSIFTTDFMYKNFAGQGLLEAQMGIDELSMAGTIHGAFSTDVLLFTAIILAIFIGGEFTLGTIKNTASKAYSRFEIYLSKWIVSVTITTVIIIINVLLYAIFSLLLWGYGNPGSGFGWEFIKMAGLELLLAAGFTSIFVMVPYLIRQGGAAIAVNICVMQFTSLGVSLVQVIFQNVFKIDIEFTRYLLSTTIAEVSSSEITGNLAVRAIFIGVFAIAAASALGIFTFQKRDIK